MSLKQRDVFAIEGRNAFWKAGQHVCMAIWCKAEQVSEELRRLRIRTSGRPSHDFDGIEDVFNHVETTPRGGRPEEKADEEPLVKNDPRVLLCHFESDGRRFRKLGECEGEYIEEVFDDWPLQGERNLTYACRHLRREERTWLGQHEHWVRSSGVRQNDRSVHEHAVLCTSLHHLTTYDQLQTINCAGAETLNARRQLIEKAHEGTPENPRWDGADDYLGFQTQSNGVLVHPRRTAYVANKQGRRATAPTTGTS